MGDPPGGIERRRCLPLHVAVLVPFRPNSVPDGRRRPRAAAHGPARSGRGQGFALIARPPATRERPVPGGRSRCPAPSRRGHGAAPWLGLIVATVVPCTLRPWRGRRSVTEAQGGGTGAGAGPAASTRTVGRDG